jgi:hypothetical protein
VRLLTPPLLQAPLLSTPTLKSPPFVWMPLMLTVQEATALMRCF